jgi:hypothetical protein
VHRQLASAAVARAHIILNIVDNIIGMYIYTIIESTTTYVQVHRIRLQ